MTKARFFLTQLDNKAILNDGGLLPEIWNIIFSKLEPSFLNSVLRTCKVFNALASSDIVMNITLSHFDVFEPKRDKSDSAYDVLKKLYAHNLDPLPAPEKKLLTLCLYLDFPQIKKFQYKPDFLFLRSLSLKNSNPVSLATLINRQQNQELRDLVFKRINDWFILYAKSKAYWDVFPFSFIWDYYTDDILYHAENSQHFRLLDFAITLNQLSFIREHANYLYLNRRPRKCIYYNLIDFACSNGHVEIVKYLLALFSQEDSNLQSNITEHYLFSAIKGNHKELTVFLLSKLKHPLAQWDELTIIRHVVDDGCLAALEAILDNIISDQVPKLFASTPNKLLEFAIHNDHPKAAALIIEKLPELLNEGDEMEKKRLRY